MLALGLVAGWGILESVLLAASLFTLIEAVGLVIILVAGFKAGVPAASGLTLPPIDGAVLSGIAYAVLLAFFALIGRSQAPIATSHARWC